MQRNYDNANAHLFKGKMTDSQRQGIDTLVAAGSSLTKEALAYVLATAYHETAATMQPIEEFGKGRNRNYGHKVRYNGKPYTDPDKIFYGRGYTQNTWIDNYEKLTKANNRGWDFVNNPELLLQPEPSAWATIYAMTTGLYTGRKLGHYLNTEIKDPINARRIINGLDCTYKIKEYYDIFLMDL